MLAPPFDFIARAFVPVLARLGAKVDVRLVRHGFYPRGGGRIEVDITPEPLQPIACTERGALLSCSATALFAGLPFDVARRELDAARKVLRDWSEEVFVVRQLPEEQGPGNILLLEAKFEHGTEIVSGFGKLGVSAESVANTAANRMAGYLASEAFAGPYLADQLLLPMTLAGGGVFTTVKPSQHCLTAADIIERFTGRRWSFVRAENGAHVAELR